jgi:hypothetical protein
MAGGRIPWLLCVALLAPLPARAAGAPEQRAAETTVSGVYLVNFHLNLASTLPAGTTITCRAQIAPQPGGLDLGNPQPGAAAVDTAAGLTTVAGSRAICATEIPFSWTVAGEPSGIVLSYEIDAVSSSGSAPLLVRSSMRQNIVAAFPAAGGSANLSFNVTF